MNRSVPARIASVAAVSLTTLTAIAALTAVSAIGCKKKEVVETAPPPAKPIAVKTATVTVKPMPRALSLTGTLTANQSSEVAANTSGVVDVQPGDRGAFVDKGTTLAKIDARNAALSAAEARVAAANAKRADDIAKQDCDRIDKLYAAGAVTEADYTRQHATCVNANGSVDSAAVRLAEAQKQLGDTIVRAPFTGMIDERYISDGEYVSPSTKVVRLVEIDPLRVELSVPEQAVGFIAQGQSIEFTVRAFDGKTFTGKVRYIGSGLRRDTRDLVAEALVPNPEKKLRPGMFATVRVLLDDAPAPTVPKKALLIDGTLRRIFVAKDGVAEERLVKIGETKGDDVQIEEGAKAGELVVLEPPAELHDGSPLSK
jgi:membrane fusion protein (multidrug efflux system)